MGDLPRATLVLEDRPPIGAGDRAAYVERGGEIVYRHPHRLTAVRMYGFVVPARMSALTAWCDRTFARPTDGHVAFRPVTPEVLVTFNDVGRATSTSGADDGIGGVAYREVMVWFPVEDERHGGIAWAVPYVFVDHGGAMASGREVYGYPKQPGRVEMTASRFAPDQLTAYAHVIRTFAADADSSVQRVLQVTRRGSGSVELPSLRDGAARLALDGAQLAADHRRVVPLLASSVATGRLRFAFLKQFRDCADPRLACYQSVVLAPVSLAEVRGGGLLDDSWQVRFDDPDSQPMARDLGVAATGEALNGFWQDLSFDVEPGVTIWERRPGAMRVR